MDASLSSATSLRRLPLPTIAIFGLALAMSTVTLAQVGEGVARPTRLDVGFGTAGAGDLVWVPIALAVPADVEVGKTVSQVTFPNKVLWFEEVKKGFAADGAGAEIETEVRVDEKDQDVSIVTVIVTSADRAIPSGFVASLGFRISHKAQAGDVIALPNLPHAFALSGEPRAIAPLTGGEGRIEVTDFAPEAVPFFGCFFYMH